MSNSIMFKVEGMSCQSCASRIDTTLHAYDNVDIVTVSIPDKSVTVIGENLDENRLRHTIEDMGFEVRDERE
ncbi:MAG: hypothetical protein DBX66_01440 [Clostridiales bacterium]|uniref:Copper chaperone CopZ n=1 Tax=Harryflintia acetispora TaxID=1849041 RepID=A0A9X8UJJ2_9FIRM|nr:MULTISPECIES: heavy metal-associated domain-containing protein [Oscillospiraceae]PWM39849.1 MAG: hypothetical protein DBX66_01440 [Clostridiales bacterium]RGB68350.1 heavy-metal-associated domain-containing protein [Harryflintia acetispora]TCL43716.1 copper chaperone CopZ [Harryflintia acetispora]